MKKLGLKGVTSLIAAVVVSAGVMATNVAAHTISLGFVPAALPGEVTFWVGNYTHVTPGNVPNEGSLKLTGVNATSYGPTTTVFNLSQWDGNGGKPVGLVDGVNNFYASGPYEGAGVYPLTNTNTLGGIAGVTGWQGVTISGLSAGDYMFEFISQAVPAGYWRQWNSSLNAIFSLGEGTVGGGGPGPSVVPLPAAFPLYAAGIAVMGFVGWRRKRKA